jgi:outer membrane protein insertion porin family
MRQAIHQSPAVPIALVAVLCFVCFSNPAKAVDRTFLQWAGKKPVIDSIHIEGNRSIPASEIRSRMYARRSNTLLALTADRRRRVQRETIQRDTLEIKYVYFLKGFLGVRLKEAIEPLPPDSNALIRVTIDEGRQYRYGPKTVSGVFPDSMRGNFEVIAGRLKTGEVMNPFEIRSAVFEMKAYLANSGYPYATVAYTLDTAAVAPQSPIHFSIASDSVVYFGKVTIEGTKAFPQYCAERELLMREGKLYRRDDILDSQRRLFESGYYSTFQLRQSEQSPERLRPDFTLSVRERKTRAITVKTGAGQSTVRDLEWNASAGFLKRNFLGSRRYDISASYGFGLGQQARLILHEYRLSFTEPWLLGLRVPLTISTTWDPRLRDPVQEFKRTALSGSAETTVRFGPEIRATLGFEYTSVQLTGLTGQLADSLGGSTSTASRRKLSFGFRRDSRDSVFVPRKGSLSRLDIQYYGGVLGGDGNYVKIQPEWSSYQRMWPGWISATRLKFGWAHQYGSPKFTFVDEAQYLGGGNSVRGFAENQLGPKDALGKPVGAEFILVFNQEFRWRTIQVFNQIPVIGNLFQQWPLWQSVFVDVGNGYRTSSEISLRNMAYSFGTGIQILSPAGPIRMDYARVIPHDNFQFTDHWHFTILYAF